MQRTAWNRCSWKSRTRILHGPGPTPSGILMSGAMLMRRARPRLASLLLGEEASTYFYVDALVVFLPKDT
jgi:hypothetical protein